MAISQETINHIANGGEHSYVFVCMAKSLFSSLSDIDKQRIMQAHRKSQGERRHG